MNLRRYLQNFGRLLLLALVLLWIGTTLAASAAPAAPACLPDSTASRLLRDTAPGLAGLSAEGN